MVGVEERHILAKGEMNFLKVIQQYYSVLVHCKAFLDDC